MLASISRDGDKLRGPPFIPRHQKMYFLLPSRARAGSGSDFLFHAGAATGRANSYNDSTMAKLGGITTICLYVGRCREQRKYPVAV